MIASFSILLSVTGIAYAVTMGMYGLSNVPAKSIALVYQNAFNDFFVCLNMGLSIIAWWCFLSAAGTTTPWVAGLFVLAEGVFVIKELINIALFHGYETSKTGSVAIEMAAHKHKAQINLVAAVALTVIIAGWCLAPESLVVGVLSLIGMGIVHWKRHDAIEQIDASMVTAVTVAQTVTDEVAPWWVDPSEPQIEATVHIDLVASNDRSCDMDRCEDWQQRKSSVTGLASQMGLFHKKSRYKQAETKVFIQPGPF